MQRCEISFLPLFESDLNEIIDYIVNTLGNPDAALRLVDEVFSAIRERSACARAFEPYRSNRERKHPYYRIYVQNYIVFYVVIDNVMEVRRILYNKRNIREQI